VVAKKVKLMDNEGKIFTAITLQRRIVSDSKEKIDNAPGSVQEGSRAAL
jgi:hypothetical protein